MSRYFDGIYRITPLGEHTDFECLVKRTDTGLILIDLKTWQDLPVDEEQLDRMKPVFIRKSEL